jgi:hypothetical protein
MGIRELIPEIARTGLLDSFDLVGEVRRTARRGLRKIEQLRGPLKDRRLPLEFYATEMIMLWEASKASRGPDRLRVFTDRIIEIRDKSPELELRDVEISRVVHCMAGLSSPPEDLWGVKGGVTPVC